MKKSKKHSPDRADGKMIDTRVLAGNNIAPELQVSAVKSKEGHNEPGRDGCQVREGRFYTPET